MLIRKEYKFYAAHRNEELLDKCRNLHGHRYGITCFFEVERTGSLTTLFADFDAAIEPLLKAEYDHGMLIHVGDPLYQTLCDHMARTGETLKLKTFSAPTTVENLAHQLFTEITSLGFRLQRLEVRETDSSVVVYSREDWVADRRYFAQRESSARPAASSAVTGTPVASSSVSRYTAIPSLEPVGGCGPASHRVSAAIRDQQHVVAGEFGKGMCCNGGIE